MSATSHTNHNLSEIFPIQVQQAQYWQFQITPEVDRSAGNRISWRLNKKFSDLIFIFDSNAKVFWILQKPNQDNNLSQVLFQEALEQIVKDLQDDLGDTPRKIINFGSTSEVTAHVTAQISVQILKLLNNLYSEEIYSKNRVKVETSVDYWGETFEFENEIKPAIAVQVKTQIVYDGTIQDFLENNSENVNVENWLIGLQVKLLGQGGKATIKQLSGIISERRQELISKTSNTIIQSKIKSAMDTDLIVSVAFGNSNALYDYPLNSLIPIVTADTAHQFNVNHGEFLKQTKLNYLKRQELTIKIIESIKKIYEEFPFSLDKSLNSKSHVNLFHKIEIDLDNVSLLFSEGFTQIKGKTLSGLRNGGVYKIHPDFRQSKTIRIGIVKPEELTVKPFYQSIKKEMDRYGFSFIDSREVLFIYNINSSNQSQTKTELERAIDKIQGLPIDFVFVFLPGSQAEDQNDVFYESVKKFLYRLDQGIASQVIYSQTVVNAGRNLQNIINNIAPGMLAKLGNIPYVLKDPLKIADMFVGLDVSRFRNTKGNGSRNVCASVRLYGNQGEFQGYRFYDALIEGEEIPQKALENFFPARDFANKSVLVYRDGRFRGEEVKALTERAKLIDAEFILVESVKSQVPRLYSILDSTDEVGNKKVPKILPPMKGLSLKLSNREIILVTTSVQEKIGVPRPLRLRIREEGTQADLSDLVDATLKLTLLHYGSLKDPRLPIPLYASDAIAYRRLQGTAPRYDDGDRQFWL